MAKKKQKSKKRKKTAKKRKPKAVKRKMKKRKKRKPRTTIKKARPRKKKKRITAETTELIHRTKIRIIGIGGGAGSIVSEIAPKIKRVDFVVANTDYQALKEVARGVRTLQFGQKLTRGLGCGMDTRLGQKAAKEEKAKIAKLFKGIDLCVLVSSLGGGTGSGAAPEFAKIARETGVITFGIFTLPFKFEGGKRAYIARSSLLKLTPNLNAVSIIPNENIFRIIDKRTPLKEAFSVINKRLAENLKGLIEMIYLPGVINIDFADVKAILEGRGKLAYLNTAQAQGSNRIEESLKDVLHSPLNEYNIRGAEKIVFNITASQDVGMKEIEEISKTISDFNRRAKIIFGISQDNNYKDKIRICLLAVGCGKEEKPKAKPKPRPKPKPKPKPKKRRRPKPKPKTKAKPKIKRKARIKIKPKPKPRAKAKRRPKPKPKPKPVPKPKKKRKKKKKVKKLKAPTLPVIVEKKEQEAPSALPTRRSAVELRKEVKKTEEEMMKQEDKWDVPAFLRRKTRESE